MNERNDSVVFAIATNDCIGICVSMIRSYAVCISWFRHLHCLMFKRQYWYSCNHRSFSCVAHVHIHIRADMHIRNSPCSQTDLAFRAGAFFSYLFWFILLVDCHQSVCVCRIYSIAKWFAHLTETYKNTVIRYTQWLLFGIGAGIEIGRAIVGPRHPQFTVLARINAKAIESRCVCGGEAESQWN